MRRRRFLPMFFLIISLSLCQDCTLPEIICVGNNPTDDVTSIQEAVRLAKAGDKIILHEEEFVLDDSIKFYSAFMCTEYSLDLSFETESGTQNQWIELLPYGDMNVTIKMNENVKVSNIISSYELFYWKFHSGDGCLTFSSVNGTLTNTMFYFFDSLIIFDGLTLKYSDHGVVYTEIFYYKNDPTLFVMENCRVEPYLNTTGVNGGITDCLFNTETNTRIENCEILVPTHYYLHNTLIYNVADMTIPVAERFFILVNNYIEGIGYYPAPPNPGSEVLLLTCFVGRGGSRNVIVQNNIFDVTNDDLTIPGWHFFMRMVCEIGIFSFENNLLSFGGISNAYMLGPRKKMNRSTIHNNVFMGISRGVINTDVDMIECLDCSAKANYWEGTVFIDRTDYENRYDLGSNTKFSFWEDWADQHFTRSGLRPFPYFLPRREIPGINFPDSSPIDDMRYRLRNDSQKQGLSLTAGPIEVYCSDLNREGLNCGSCVNMWEASEVGGSCDICDTSKYNSSQDCGACITGVVSYSDCLDCVNPLADNNAVPKCSRCSNPKYDFSADCNSCLPYINQSSYPQCDTCVSILHDFSYDCERCIEGTMGWPDCDLGDELTEPIELTCKWIHGSENANELGSFGSIGQFSGTNIPSTRIFHQSWMIDSSNILIFGGQHLQSTWLNDLWIYSIPNNEFAWIHGSDQFNHPGVKGTPAGLFNETVIPGARESSVGLTGISGEVFVLFGGLGKTSVGATSEMNDLFWYNVSSNEFALMKGDPDAPQASNYGTQDEYSTQTIPGGRFGMFDVQIGNGVLLIFGGFGKASILSSSGALNDVFFYDYFRNEFKFVKGSKTINDAGTVQLDEIGVYYETNLPSGRFHGVSGKVPNTNDGVFFFGGGGQAGMVVFNISTNNFKYLGGEDGLSESDGPIGKFGEDYFPAIRQRMFIVPTFKTGSSSFIIGDGDTLWYLDARSKVMQFARISESLPYRLDDEGFQEYSRYNRLGERAGTLSLSLLETGGKYLFFGGGTNDVISRNDVFVCKTKVEITCFGQNYSAVDVCSSNGDCVRNDTCFCNQTWYGRNCSDYKCFGVVWNNDTVCSGRGPCISSDKCNCPLHYDDGMDCSLVPCYGETNPEACSGTNGDCVNYNDCQCGLNYWGQVCNVTTCNGVFSNDSSVCNGRGTCGPDYDTCECIPYPHVNNLDYCSCETNYYGNLCDITYCYGVISNDSSVCNGRGTCEQYENCDCYPYPHVNDTEYCNCETNYYGSGCNITSCHGVLSNDTGVCSGHGVCIEFDECDCESTSYQYIDCSIFTCFDIIVYRDDVCGGEDRGTCVASDTCECSENYYSPDCAVTNCFGVFSNDTNNVCSGRGDCVGFNECDCPENYVIDCSVTSCNGIVSNNENLACSGNGDCVGFDDCECDEFYIDEWCNVTFCFEVLSNDSTTCNGHGICIDYNICECDEKYAKNPDCSAVSDSGGVIAGILVPLLLILCFGFVGFGIVAGILLFFLGRKYFKYKDVKDLDIILEEQKMIKGSGLSSGANKKMFDVDYSKIKILEIIGLGGSGSTCYRCEYEGEIYALKSFDTSSLEDTDKLREFEREIYVLSTVKHPNILGYYGATLTEKGKFSLLLEYCEKGDLAKFLTKNVDYPMKERMRFLKEIASSMRFLQTRDPSAGECFRIYKADGLRTVSESSRSESNDDNENRNKLVKFISFNSNFLNKPGCYIAPEMMIGDRLYDEKCDIYSYGILCWTILSVNMLPYGSNDVENIEMRVARDPNLRPQVSDLDVDEWLKTLLKSCWDHEPSVRPSFKMICETLSNPSKGMRKEDSVVLYLRKRDQSDENAEDFLLLDRSIDGLHRHIKDHMREEKAIKSVCISSSAEVVSTDEDVKKLKEDTVLVVEFAEQGVSQSFKGLVENVEQLAKKREQEMREIEEDETLSEIDKRRKLRELKRRARKEREIMDNVKSIM